VEKLIGQDMDTSLPVDLDTIDNLIIATSVELVWLQKEIKMQQKGPKCGKKYRKH